MELNHRLDTILSVCSLELSVCLPMCHYKMDVPQVKLLLCAPINGHFLLYQQPVEPVAASSPLRQDCCHTRLSSPHPLHQNLPHPDHRQLTSSLPASCSLSLNGTFIPVSCVIWQRQTKKKDIWFINKLYSGNRQLFFLSLQISIWRTGRGEWKERGGGRKKIYYLAFMLMDVLFNGQGRCQMELLHILVHTF